MNPEFNKVFVIAEIGSVHDGSLGNAFRLIDAAAESGADAVKFQTHIAAEETTRGAPSPGYFSDEDRFEYFERTGFDESEWIRIKAHCDASGVTFMSSPFSEAAVDMLDRIGMQIYKIPSGEITNTPMLRHIADTGMSVILSSGMSNWDELDRAVEIFRAKSALTLLQCSSSYPCADENVGLNVMAEMRQRFGVSVGLSDHTTGPYASLAATCLGATVIEKHFAFSKKMYGSDARHSMEPEQFSEMVRGIRAITAMLSSPVDKNHISGYRDMKNIFEKSLVSSRRLEAGTVLCTDDICVKKPGTGIPAAELENMLGRKLAVPVEDDSLFKLSDFEVN